MGKNNCPVCGKDIQYSHIEDAPAFPFCSERCRWADLGDWLEGRHVISTPIPDAVKGNLIEKKKSQESGGE